MEHSFGFEEIDRLPYFIERHRAANRRSAGFEQRGIPCILGGCTNDFEPRV
jgi:hypothetical protein